MGLERNFGGGGYSVLAFVSGVSTGLAAITPGSGFTPNPICWIAPLCAVPPAFFFSSALRDKYQVEDVLDVCSLQAVPGIIGTLVVGFV